MTFDRLNRRTHLYLGLALIPWVLMYGASSVPFAHNAYFQARDAATGLPPFTVRAEIPVDVAIPDDREALRALGATLLDKAGIHGTNFGAYRQGPSQVNVYSYTFWKSTQLKYDADRQVMTVEDRRFRWDQFLTGMHARGGFEQEGILPTAWSLIIDLVCLSLIGWVASGVYMWWRQPRLRRLGWIALASGALPFLLFTLGL
jgi:hypothetical protein